MELEVGLLFSLGFLGSFGHCLGMCGPLSTALLLSDRLALSESLPQSSSQFSILNSQFRNVLLLNLGRLFSYTLVGAAIGGIGSTVMAGGQWAGIGSGLRQGLAMVAGLLLIWSGLLTVYPDYFKDLPILYPLRSSRIHTIVSGWMGKLVMASPLVLGSVWGLMPCGFLYAAQIKAAETSNPIQGALMMLAFGLGTLPMMLGVGGLAAHWSAERRSQLFRLGGWVAIAIGGLTLFRSSEMNDWSGHGALLLLMVALLAGPIAPWWNGLLLYRRAIGVGAFVLAIVHTSHMLSHAYQWNLWAITFLARPQQGGMIAGFGALLCLLLPAVTSFDAAIAKLGRVNWRRLHLLSVPALLLGVGHAMLVGSHYLGNLEVTSRHWNHTIGLGLVTIVLLGVRQVGRLLRNPRLNS